MDYGILKTRIPKLIVNVKGEDLDATPMFKTKHLPLHKLMKNLVTNVPSVQLYKLTPELKYVTTTDNEVDSSSLVHHFNYFTEKLDSIWKQFNAKHQQESQLYTPTNDKLFINELSQLIHLSEKSIILLVNLLMFSFSKYLHYYQSREKLDLLQLHLFMPRKL